MERDALRLLLSSRVKPGTRQEICRLLQPSDFVDPLHRSVFEEVKASGSIGSRRLRAELAGHLIRRGFLGFNLDKLLVGRLAHEVEIEKLFQSTLCLLKLDGTSHPAHFRTEADVQN
jgi:hypothetical protein